MVTALTTHGIQRILQCNTIMRDYNVPCLTIQEKCFSNTASVTSVQLSSQACSSIHTIPTNTGRIRIFTARRHTLGCIFGTGIYCPFARAVNTEDAYPCNCGAFMRPVFFGTPTRIFVLCHAILSNNRDHAAGSLKAYGPYYCTLLCNNRGHTAAIIGAICVLKICASLLHCDLKKRNSSQSSPSRAALRLVRARCCDYIAPSNI
jgi:hypothetical protein